MRSRAAAGLLLLALTAHAFIAGTTHFHRIPPSRALPAQVVLGSGEGRGEGTPLGGDEKQCLLCRLQRNLVTDIEHTTLVIAAPHAWTPVPEHLHQASARAGTATHRQGRAPPSIQS